MTVLHLVLLWFLYANVTMMPRVPVDATSCPTENANNQKLMAEYEKYQELQARSQKLQEVSITIAHIS